MSEDRQDQQSQPDQTEPQTDPAAPTPQPVEDQAPPSEPAPSPRVTDWRDREIHRLRDQVRSLKAAPAPAAQTGPAPLDLSTLSANQEFQRLVQQEAARQAEQLAVANEFNRQCQKTLDDGRKGFPDFDQRVAALKGLVDFNDQGQTTSYNSFLIAAIETGDAPRLLHELGGDPNEAARIMAMPPVKMAVELAKMATREPEQQTAAPRPIIPVTRTSANRTPIDPRDVDRADQLSTREWMERRNRQIADARGR